MKYVAITIKLLLSIAIAAACYYVTGTILGWASNEFGYQSEAGHILGVAMVVFSPLGFGILIFPLYVVIVYWVIGKIRQLFNKSR